MKPLSTNRGMLSWLCILPANENASKCENILHIAFTVALIALEMSIFISSGAFILENASTDLQVSLHAVFQIIAAIGLTYMMISGLIFRRKVAAMIQTLSNFYNKSKEPFQLNQILSFILKFYRRKGKFSSFLDLGKQQK